MKKILLLTSNNNFYLNAFQKKNYSFLAGDYFFSEDDFIKAEKNNFDFYIIETDHNNFQQFREFIKKNVFQSEILVLASEINEALSKFLKEQGISDVLSPGDISKISFYLNLKKMEIDQTEGDKDKFIIWDETKNNIKILKSLISRFDYQPLFVNSAEELFSNLNLKDLQFIFINLGTEGLDINDFLKKTYLYPDIKKIPTIVYKDMEVGLFVNEIVSGLNKLTKVILSSEELYSFLVDILYRQELISLIHKIKKGCFYEENSFLVDRKLGQSYFNKGEDLFFLNNIFSSEKTKEILGLNNKIRKLIYKTESLRWLKKDNNNEVVKTCGWHA